MESTSLVLSIVSIANMGILGILIVIFGKCMEILEPNYHWE